MAVTQSRKDTASSTRRTEFAARARGVWYSPYKLRPVADVVRGKNAAEALAWLSTYRTQRAVAIRKLIESAIANARHLEDLKPEALTVAMLQVDQGPIHRYFKPGAMGRAMVQRKRLCHISLVLRAKEQLTR